MTKIKMIKILTISFLIFFSLFINVGVYAQGPALVPGSGGDAQDSKYLSGDYEVNDFLQVALNVSQWILIISGSLALLAFIVGGLMFILSHGNRELVEKGKAALIGATIGLAIVFLAFTAVDYFMDKIGYKGGPFGSNWNSSAGPK
jgi:hypothetical protein